MCKRISLFRLSDVPTAYKLFDITIINITLLLLLCTQLQSLFASIISEFHYSLDKQLLGNKSFFYSLVQLLLYYYNRPMHSKMFTRGAHFRQKQNLKHMTCVQQ